MNAIGGLTLAVLGTIVATASPRWAALALIAGVMYMTLGQAIDIEGFNIYPMRVLTLLAFVRVVLRSEWSWSSINDLDKALLLAYGYRTVVFIANGNGSAVNAVGLMVDVCLAYFAFRGLLKSVDDLSWVVRYWALLLIPYVGLLFVASSTGQNPFVAIGGIESAVVRGDRLRAIGSFGHASILGSFGAAGLPMFIALWMTGSHRRQALLGVVCSLAIVYFSNSGGPFTCAIITIAGWFLWRWRLRLHVVRQILGGLFVLLILVMEAPIWYLPARISDLTGGDGWHRSYLMDIAIGHLDRWWLAGMSVLETKAWFSYTVVTGGADIINYYLDFGIAAGVVAIVLFVRLLVRLFKTVGAGMAQARPRSDLATEYWLFGLGVALAMHVFNWFGIVYFDQCYAVLFMQFAAISGLAQLQQPSVNASDSTPGTIPRRVT